MKHIPSSVVLVAALKCAGVTKLSQSIILTVFMLLPLIPLTRRNEDRVQTSELSLRLPEEKGRRWQTAAGP